MFEDRRYLIINVSEINLVDFSKLLQPSEEYLIRSADFTKAIIKWSGDTPSFVLNLTSKEGPYLLEEIREILKTPEWTQTNPTP